MRTPSRHPWHGLSCVLFLLAGLFLLPGAHSQTLATGGLETATQDRLEDPGWWPTKGSYPRSSFVGNATCEQCHASLFRSQRTTPMAMAAGSANNSHLLRQHTSDAFQNGPYTYRLLSGDAAPVLAATDGNASETTSLPWTFGSGELGQTFVFQREGRWFESRVSLYAGPGQLDITTGHGRMPPETIHDALGRKMEDADAQRCFGCHTGLSTVAGHFEPESAIPGITCEACHGPGADHAKVMAAGGVQSGSPGHASRIMNPATMNPVDSVDFCGTCHRTWADVAFSGVTKHGVDVVRFQPYRLEKSRCWGKAGDARLTCVACHDPHAPLQRDVVSYDVRCLSCHLRQNEVATAAKPGAACPRSSDHCTTCHMPKISMPEMHGQFTDHFIRIAGQDGTFPQ